MLKGLTARGHRVTAFAPCANSEEAAEAKRVFPAPEYALNCFEYSKRGYVASKFASLRRPQSYLYSGQFETALYRTLREPYDILHLEQQWSGWLTLPSRPRTVLNVHCLFRLDCPERPAGGLVEQARHRRMWDAEVTLLRSFPRVCTLTTEMSDEVRSIHPHASIHTVPFGMVLENYSFVDNSGDRESVVTLIGSMDWLPTRMAAARLLTKLWPSIRGRVPAARLQIVGRDARSVLRDSLNTPGLTVHENVPDIIPYFRDATVLLYAPERGSGMKVKVLESFALGLPVVTSRSGVEGIPAVDGVHAGICEDDSGLIDRCVALLEDSEARRRQRISARQLVERHCSADRVLDTLEAVYEETLASDRGNVVA
jgi:glycosyltransferase involved in cell wall biosynthesis